MILAQRWLHLPHKPTKWDDVLRSHLEINTKGMATDVAMSYTERLVYNHELPSTLTRLVNNNGIDIKMMYNTMKMPSDRVWVEYNTEIGDKGVWKIGGMFLQYNLEQMRLIIVMGTETKFGWVSGITHVIRFERWPPKFQGSALPLNMHYHFTTLDEFARDKGYQSDTRNMVDELVFGLFLITQPRTIETQDHVHAYKQQRARVKLGKPPLIDYRRVNIKIATGKRQGGVDTRQDHATIQNTSGGGRKQYHHVLGHFRHYGVTDKRKEAHTTWIDDHWRGDPSLGVILHERNVKR